MFLTTEPCIDMGLYERLTTRLPEIMPELDPEQIRAREWLHWPEWSRDKWKKYRFIYLLSGLETDEIHYEYTGGYVWLHLEGEFGGPLCRRQLMDLKKGTRRHGDLDWYPAGMIWEWPCCRIGGPVNGLEDLVDKFRRAREIFEPLLKEVFQKRGNDLCQKYSLPKPGDMKVWRQLERVSVRHCDIGQIMNMPLAIPAYQRNYCWEDREIASFWNTLAEPGDMPLHLGSIILQENEKGELEIVDGQQRLVTLALILWALGHDGNLPLLCQRFRDKAAVEHVANAKALILNMLASAAKPADLQNILNRVSFTVLFIDSQNPDLAYIFFTNQNSKGIRLNDYELLKAHHLRFIAHEAQAEHMAKKWIVLSHEAEGETLKIARYLGGHIYRMRKLLRKLPFFEWGHYVRDEFQAAAIMEDVPPFGEKFLYHEPIQGGVHFFVFAERFNAAYSTFLNTVQLRLLRSILAPAHCRYAEIIECLLFCYYLKFDHQYLSEALFCICAIMGEHRYGTPRASQSGIETFVRESNLIHMIEYASSPTFFMAEVLKSAPKDIWAYEDATTSGIRLNYYTCLCRLFRSLPELTETAIKDLIANEY